MIQGLVMVLLLIYWIVCVIGSLFCYFFIPQDFGEHSMFIISIIYFFKYWYFTIPSAIGSCIMKLK